LDPADAQRLAGRIPLKNNRIRIPETLLISAIGVIEDVNKCVTMDAKRFGGAGILPAYKDIDTASQTDASAAGETGGAPRSVAPQKAGRMPAPQCGTGVSPVVVSEAGRMPAPQETQFLFIGLKAPTWPEARIADAARLHTAVAGLIARGAVLAAHDCGEEGWLATVAVMAFAGRCG